LDTATPQISKIPRESIKANDLSLLPHPPFSPDLVPSDFYLFGYIKTELRASHGRTQEDLFANVDHILRGFSSDELRRVYLEWMEGLEHAISAKGDYV
jgi:histone-lysine N-methyltransferase SETMAR